MVKHLLIITVTVLATIKLISLFFLHEKSKVMTQMSFSFHDFYFFQKKKVRIPGASHVFLFVLAKLFLVDEGNYVNMVTIFSTGG